MNSTTTIDGFASQVAELVAERPTGVVSLQELADALKSRVGGTVQTSRARIRRVIEQRDDLGLVELTSRRGDWRVELSPSDGRGGPTAAWLAQGYDYETRRTVWRLVSDSKLVTSPYGSGKTSWVTTRVAIDRAISEFAQKLAAEREETARRYRAESDARWEQARERDPEYAQLLQLLGQEVPDANVRVVCPVHAPGVWAAVEVDAGAAGSEKFKALLRRALIEEPQQRQELEELRAVFDLQSRRLDAATALWRQADPVRREGKLPDLGELLEWLIGQLPGAANTQR